MAMDVYKLVDNCAEWSRNWGNNLHQRDLKGSPASGLLELVAMEILGPFPKMSNGNHFVIVMKERHEKLTHTIPLSRNTASQAALKFISNWVMTYSFPNFLVMDNGMQFASKLFNTLCSLLSVKKLTTTAYHPQTNGQTELLNKTTVARLRQ